MGKKRAARTKLNSMDNKDRELAKNRQDSGQDLPSEAAAGVAAPATGAAGTTKTRTKGAATEKKDLNKPQGNW